MDVISILIIDADEANRNFLAQLLQKMTLYMMGNFSLANNQNISMSLKFPTATAAMAMKQAALEMSQKVVKMQKQKGYKRVTFLVTFRLEFESR